MTTAYAFYTVEATPSSDVASAGTIAFGYPTGTGLGNFENTKGHKLFVEGHQRVYDHITDFTVAFTSVATVTYNGSTTIPAGTRVSLQLNTIEVSDSDDYEDIQKVTPADVVVIDLGAPATIDVDGIFEAYTGSTPALDGALVSGGVATMDVPRNIVIDSGGADTAVLTFTGTDVHGSTMVESITLNGTTAVSGKKAFKTITAVASSAAIANGAFAGPGDVLGLPVRLPDAGYVLREMEDGAAPTAGTIVGAVDTAATATTGDVRGTYDPNSAADGSKVFKLIAALPDVTDKGVAQYAG